MTDLISGLVSRGNSVALWKAKLPKVVGGFVEKIKMDVVKYRFCLILGG